MTASVCARGLLIALSIFAPGCGNSDSQGGATDAGTADNPDLETRWRSSLYPLDWTSGLGDAGGRFLHDFSYAGYHNQPTFPEMAPGPPVVDASLQGADKTGAGDATAAIQKTIDMVAKTGGVVLLPKGLYRLDGVLKITASNVVVRGEGADNTKLYFTRFQGMTDGAHITFQGTVKEGPDLPLTVEGKVGSFDVLVADASSLHPGDDVSVGWTITPEFVSEHGMTGVWTSFNGQWKPFFRRQVIEVDTKSTPNRVRLDVPLRYKALLRDGASLRSEKGYLSECGLELLSISNAVAWNDAWTPLRVHAIDMLSVKDSWIRDVHSFASPLPEAMGFHLQGGGLRVQGSKRVTVANTQMELAQNRGDGGCGYLFEVSASSEVLFRDCVAKKGRHNFIQNWDFGTSGCVWLRCRSEGSRSFSNKDDKSGYIAFCEFHHSLAMANLIDSCTLDDGWYAGNRGLESSGAGQSVTESVFWNSRGAGYLASWQYGWGYVIGTTDLRVITGLNGVPFAVGTAPEDFVEGIDRGDTLEPQSLYEAQLFRRTHTQGLQ